MMPMTERMQRFLLLAAEDVRLRTTHVAVYLSLCAMAFAAAWVRVASRGAPAVVVGIVALGSAVAFGIAQLP